MNKPELEHQLKNNANTYNDKIRNVDSETVETRWATGGDPLSMEPFRMEMLGLSPGKFLDAPPKKISKNKIRYCFDKKNRAISKTEYAEPYNKSQWIVYREFYEHLDSQILRYSYGSAIDGQEDSPSLQKVACIEFKNNQAISVKELVSRRLEYTETIYKYRNNEIYEIEINWPETGSTRVISVEIKEDSVHLYEVTQSGMEQIYPEQ